MTIMGGVSAATTAVGSTSLKSALARLRDLERAQLQQLWRGLYGSDPPEQISRQLLLLGVAHRLQVKALGGLNFSTRRALEKAGNERPSGAEVDAVLLKTIAHAYRWFDEILSGEGNSLTAIAAREGVNRRFVGKIIGLAFRAPEIVEAIVDGRQPPELSAELLTKRINLPLDWDDQKRLLNIS